MQRAHPLLRRRRLPSPHLWADPQARSRAASCQLAGSYETITVSQAEAQGCSPPPPQLCQPIEQQIPQIPAPKRRRNPAPSAHPVSQPGPSASRIHTSTLPHLSPHPPRSWPRPAREGSWGLRDSLWRDLLSLTRKEAVYTTVGGRLAFHSNPLHAKDSLFHPPHSATGSCGSLRPCKP